MEIQHISTKNMTADKPNEDGLYINEKEKLFVVVDGVTRDRKATGEYPNPSPTVTVVDAFIDFIKHKYNPKQSLTTLFTLANHHIQMVNSQMQTQHTLTGFQPALVAIALRIKNTQDSEDLTEQPKTIQKAEWISIGDCIGLQTIIEDMPTRFNTCQTADIEKHHQKYGAQFIRTKICNNPDHEHAYGVINGDPKAVNFFETGEFLLSSAIENTDNKSTHSKNANYKNKSNQAQAIYMMSDGLEMFTNTMLTKQLNELSITEITTLAEKIEKQQNLRTDDKTLIKILL